MSGDDRGVSKRRGCRLQSDTGWTGIGLRIIRSGFKKREWSKFVRAGVIAGNVGFPSSTQPTQQADISAYLTEDARYSRRLGGAAGDTQHSPPQAPHKQTMTAISPKIPDILVGWVEPQAIPNTARHKRHTSRPRQRFHRRYQIFS